MSDIETLLLSHDDLTFSASALGSGPVVLFLHGFPDTRFTFEHQLPAFAAAGYRAIAVAMRGYEPSSQPINNDYSMDAIAGDVIAFVKQLNCQQVHLVGHDWGAAVAYNAANIDANCFKSITTMAVPHSGRFLNEIIKHPRQLKLSWYMMFFQFNGVAEYCIKRNDFAFLKYLWRTWSPDWQLPNDQLEHLITVFSKPGVIKSAVGYYREALSIRSLLPSGRAASRFLVDVPTLAVTGENDGCIDSYVFEAMMYEEDFPAGLQVKRIANAGHFLHQEQPDAVNHIILNWIKQWQ